MELGLRQLNGCSILILSLGALLAAGFVLKTCEDGQHAQAMAAHSLTPVPRETPDEHGLISAAGHVRPGTVLYLRGERIGPITSVRDERSELYSDHRILHIVHIDFNGRPDQTDMASVLRLYRVRPDEK